MRERVVMIAWWAGAVQVSAPGESLLDEKVNDGIILLDGGVRIENTGKDPVTVDAPNLLGEMKQFMPDGTRTGTVIAHSECIVLRFMWHDFVQLSFRYLNKTEQAALKEAILADATTRLAELYENTDPA